jgi:hypothetical protein
MDSGTWLAIMRSTESTRRASPDLSSVPSMHERLRGWIEVAVRHPPSDRRPLSGLGPLGGRGSPPGKAPAGKLCIYERTPHLC